MTEQEQQLIAQLFQGLRQQASAPKDAQADAAIRQHAAQLPDATYLLTQRSLLLEQALQQAQQQVEQLQSQLQQSSPAPAQGSFLSPGLDTRFGRGSDSSYAAPPNTSQGNSYYGGVPAGTPAGSAAPGSWRDRWFGSPRTAAPAMPAAPAPAPAPAAGSSFLGQAAASAAGIAGGMLLFNGLNHLWGNQAGNHQAAMDTNSSNSNGEHGNAASHGDNSGLDQLAQDAGRDHVGQSPSQLLDDGNADDGFGSDFSDGGGFFDNDDYA